MGIYIPFGHRNWFRSQFGFANPRPRMNLIWIKFLCRTFSSSAISRCSHILSVISWQAIFYLYSIWSGLTCPLLWTDVYLWNDGDGINKTAYNKIKLANPFRMSRPAVFPPQICSSTLLFRWMRFFIYWTLTFDFGNLSLRGYVYLWFLLKTLIDFVDEKSFNGKYLQLDSHVSSTWFSLPLLFNLNPYFHPNIFLFLALRFSRSTSFIHSRPCWAPLLSHGYY